MRGRALVAGGFVCLFLGAGPAGAADGPVYGTAEQVEGHSYAYWNTAWARFEWEPGGAASLLHPEGCRHTTTGHVVLLPGPGKNATIRCTLASATSVFLPTASSLFLKGSKTDTKASLRKDAERSSSSVKVVDVSLDGSRLNARRFWSVTPFFLLRPRKGSPIGVVGSRAALQAGYNLLLRPLAAGTHRVAEHVKIVDGGKTVFESRVRFVLVVRA
jgi:hypothetical protein